MACTARQERELKLKYEKEKRVATDPLDILRAHLLASGGVRGLKSLGLMFKRVDVDGNKHICFGEFQKAIKHSGVELDGDQMKALFERMDRDNNGTVDFDEFIIALRPPMSASRKRLINMAFRKLDKTGDGVVTTEDLHGVFSGKKHPKYLSGEWTEEQVLQNWLYTFDTNRDGTITENEFENYYVSVSASIDSDVYFDLMMRNAWKL